MCQTDVVPRGSDSVMW